MVETGWRTGCSVQMRNLAEEAREVAHVLRAERGRQPCSESRGEHPHERRLYRHET